MFKKLLISAMAALAFVAAPAQARVPHHHKHHVTGTTNVVTDGDTYTNVDGRQIHRPVHSASKPAGASAKCGDGSYSFSAHRRGTCSHHGGVAMWY